MRELRHLDLFSGIGGFSLAARWTGAIDTVAFCEIDPFCQKVLNKNFPGVPIISDIREVTGERIREIIADTIDKGLFRRCGGSDRNGTRIQEGEQTGDITRGATARCDENHIDILTGGFPCQPFSCAGKRKGTEDNRFIWPEMLRVIRQVEPTWVIAENVRGLLSIDNGVVFEQCCSEMEALSYEVQPFVIPACAVNAPHRRDRVWIVGYSASSGRETRNAFSIGNGQESWQFADTDCHAPDTECGEQLPGYENGSILRERGTREVDCGGAVDVTDTDLTRPQGRDEYGECTGERSFGPGHTEQWAEDWYTVALRTCVRGMDDGLPRRVDRVNRLKALGNAIVPQVAFEILKAIIEAEGEL